MKAIDNFDLSQNVKFSTYAVPMIIGEIRRYLRDNNPLRVSRSLRDIAYKSLQVRDSLTSKNGKEPTIGEIASELNVPREEVVFALDAIQEPISLFEPIYHDGGDPIFVMDQISDDKSVDSQWLEGISIERYVKLNERADIEDGFFDGRTKWSGGRYRHFSGASIPLGEDGLKTYSKVYRRRPGEGGEIIMNFVRDNVSKDVSIRRRGLVRDDKSKLVCISGRTFARDNVRKNALIRVRTFVRDNIIKSALIRVRAFVRDNVRKNALIRVRAFVRDNVRKHARIRVRAVTGIILIILCLLCLLCGEWVSEEIMAKMNQSQANVAFTSNNLIRLHIIANSDQTTDQQVKLLVRDRILRETEHLIQLEKGATALDLLKQKRRHLQTAALDELRRNGYDYSARIRIGRFTFPEKEYPFGVLPAGEYNALQVILGEGNGRNWWCVLFPPVCHLTMEEKPKNQGEEVRLRWRAWENMAHRKEELATAAGDWFRLFQLATITSTELPMTSGHNQAGYETVGE